MKKKIIALVIVAALAAGGFYTYKSGIIQGNTGTDVAIGDIYVMSLSEIMGATAGESPSVFMGVVEGQETTGVNKGSERDIDQVFVQEGDSVAKGDALFSYKTDSLEANIVSYGYDIEGYKLQINEYNRQITTLTNSMNKAKKQEEKDDYADQIAGVQMSIAIAMNSIEQTNAKITETQARIDNSIVYAPVGGVIKSVANENDPTNTDGSYITILGANEMKVKGTVNEQNVASINVGQRVTLRSRVDESLTWSGEISKIDTESTVKTDSNAESSEDRSTKYPFYITLDDSEGLMMGQHLYVEIDSESYDEAADYSTGVHVYDYYVCFDENGNAFVWKKGTRDKLEKQIITLNGEADDNGAYEVSEGLTMEDMIAYPMDD